MVLCAANLGRRHELADADLIEQARMALSSEVDSRSISALSGLDPRAEWVGQDPKPNHRCGVEQAAHQHRRRTHPGLRLLAAVAGDPIEAARLDPNPATM